MALNICDAAIEQLRATAAVTQAFGDTFDTSTQTGTPKFFGDWAAEVAEPYAVVQEIGETYDYQTPTAGNYRSYIATGRLQVAIYAPGRQQARDLGVQLAFSLNDAALAWPGSNLMYLRMAQASFVPLPHSAPGSPTQFVRVIVFDYQFSSQL